MENVLSDQAGGGTCVGSVCHNKEALSLLGPESRVAFQHSWGPQAIRGSDLLWGANHDLRHKVDNGTSRLLRVMFRKQVAHVVCGTALLPRHKSKDF